MESEEEVPHPLRIGVRMEPHMAFVFAGGPCPECGEPFTAHTGVESRSYTMGNEIRYDVRCVCPANMVTITMKPAGRRRWEALGTVSLIHGGEVPVACCPDCGAVVPWVHTDRHDRACPPPLRRRNFGEPLESSGQEE